MKNILLVFGTKNFNNSLIEIEEYLDFSLIFFNEDILSQDIISSANALLIDSEVCNDEKNTRLINSITSKPILLIEKQGFIKKCNCTDKSTFPLMLSDLNSRLVALISSEKFNQNSFIKINEYIVDKNEKKFKKGNVSISITEREIQLIELLFKEKKPLSRNTLLKRIWKYSKDADTHTVETHIYRLRKKILSKFNDEEFIINNKAGYSI